MSGERQPLPGSHFISWLVAANRLEKSLGQGCLLFFQGMRFASRQKWWGNGGLRDQTHEGLDLCFFADAEGNRFRLDDTIRVPAACDGEVAGVIPDFLDSTVIVAHRPFESAPPVYLLYAHIRPDEKLQVGQNLSGGQTFASIAPNHERQLMPPHLHLSLMHAHNMPAVDSLGWPLLNLLDRRRFLDPMAIIDWKWQEMNFVAGVDLYKTFGSS